LTSSPRPEGLARGRRRPLEILRTFFRTGAAAFLLLSFAFEVSDTGSVWIMWRDAPLLAGTLAALAVLMGLGWLTTARLLREAAESGDGAAPAPRPHTRADPYNVWKEMDLRGRLRLAFAVFLIFATIGPLVTLMEGATEPVRPLQVLLVTFASGAIAASVILFGNRPVLLVAALLLFVAVERYAADLTAVLEGHPPPPPRAAAAAPVLLTPERQTDLRAQRVLIGFGAVILIASGYVMFLVLLTGEGRQRARLQTEVEIARRIQCTLLPQEGLRTPWCDVAGSTAPATEVGGDYYDYVELPDGRIAVVVADVAGHGVGAGILSAMTKSAFRAHLGHSPGPGQMLDDLNRTLCQILERKMFVTMASIVIDPATRKARIATAGHPPVLHQRGGAASFEEVRTPSLGLGMNRDAVFREIEVDCGEGDRFILYTDGVIEASPRSGVQFGADRLRATVAQSIGLSAGELAARILRAVREFVGDDVPADDATVVTVRIGEAGGEKAG